jgi:hypothetical protein
MDSLKKLKKWTKLNLKWKINRKKSLTLYYLIKILLLFKKKKINNKKKKSLSITIKFKKNKIIKIVKIINKKK